MGILCVFCVYDTIGNSCFEKTSFPKTVDKIQRLLQSPCKSTSKYNQFHKSNHNVLKVGSATIRTNALRIMSYVD